MISAGHPPADAWSYTPRQIKGFLALAGRRRTREYAERLSIAAAGARGDPKAIKKVLKDAERE